MEQDAVDAEEGQEDGGTREEGQGEHGLAVAGVGRAQQVLERVEAVGRLLPVQLEEDVPHGGRR